MSRCFPFPPPGYEKKPKSDHVDFLIKEKSKEKGHKKKEKREKEKRESKERKDKHKDKDRSKGKHREKKDKKEKHRDKGKKKGKDTGRDDKRISNERNGQGHREGPNEEKLAEDGREADIHKDSSFTEELVQRIRDEESGAATQMGEQITGEFQRFKTVHIQGEKGRNISNEMVHNITVPDQRRMVMASAMEDRGTGNAMPRSTEQRTVDGMGRSTDKDAKKRVEAKEEAKEWKVNDRKGDTNKDTGQEKRRTRKDKDKDKEKAKEEKIREKEKAKEEKRREKEEHKPKEQDKSIGNGERRHVDLLNVGSSFNPQENKRSAGAETSLKRKEINGFLHEKEVRPNKMSRPASSSQLPVENGRKLDPSHIATPCASDRHEDVNIMVGRVLESGEHKINGIIDVQPPSDKSGPLPVAGVIVSGETFNKPPHPDEKHLSWILRLPKMDELPEFDDQEWLLGRDDARQKSKTKLEADEMPQVWHKALHIDSADVLALPYVIPY